MSMRRRVFLLNMLMMVTAMLILFGAITGFMRYRLSDYDESREWISNVDDNAFTVMRILENAAKEPSDWEGMQREMDPYGYMLFVCRDGEIIYPKDFVVENRDWIAEIRRNAAEGIHVAYGNTYADVSFDLGEHTYYLAALCVSDETTMDRMNHGQILAYIYRIVLIGSVTILIVACLGWVFSKAMVNRVVKPLDLLIDSLKVVGRGERAKPIVYHGDKEFERVCETFNAMQEEIADHERERRKYEEQRTDMVTSISHDLRTPLTSIKGYIKAIMDGVADTPEKRDRFLQIAYDTTGEMDQLLQKLFVFSKIETGKMPLYPVRIDMEEYLAQYVERRSSAWTPEEMTLIMQGCGEHYEGLYDVLQMQRVFDNLLENSLHYAGCAPVQITITVAENDAEEIISFHDNGYGVPEEKLPYIFDRFYRCDEARGQEGNGVGLYIVKYIVEAHQGRAEAVNRDGFEVSLHFPKGGADREQDIDCRG